jgi:hypothetical protein
MHCNNTRNVQSSFSDTIHAATEDENKSVVKVELILTVSMEANLSGKALGNILQLSLCTYRVARWFIFKPKIPIWANFVGSFNGRCWQI